jgi:hypothetical protein
MGTLEYCPGSPRSLDLSDVRCMVKYKYYIPTAAIDSSSQLSRKTSRYVMLLAAAITVNIIPPPRSSPAARLGKTPNRSGTLATIGTSVVYRQCAERKIGRV